MGSIIPFLAISQKTVYKKSFLSLGTTVQVLLNRLTLVREFLRKIVKYMIAANFESTNFSGEEQHPKWKAWLLQFFLDNGRPKKLEL